MLGSMQHPERGSREVLLIHKIMSHQPPSTKPAAMVHTNLPIVQALAVSGPEPSRWKQAAERGGWPQDGHETQVLQSPASHSSHRLQLCMLHDSKVR